MGILVMGDDSGGKIDVNYYMPKTNIILKQLFN